MQKLKSKDVGRQRMGITLADLDKCFQTLPQMKRSRTLPADASYFVLQPSSPLLTVWDWSIRALSFYFFWEVPLNIAFRTFGRLGMPPSLLATQLCLHDAIRPRPYG